MIWNVFYDFGTTFRVKLGTLKSLLEHFAYIFRVKKGDWGAKGAPRGATLIIPYHIWIPFGCYFFGLFPCFDGKKVVLDTRRFFTKFLGCTECFGGWARMQSVHVYVVQTHF